MWRTRAIVARLVDDVAALTVSADDDPVDLLVGARKRARAVAALDLAALAILFLLRDPASAFMPLGPTTESVFTLAVVAVAVHAGFRLGQVRMYSGLEALARDLEERTGEPRA